MGPAAIYVLRGGSGSELSVDACLHGVVVVGGVELGVHVGQVAAEGTDRYLKPR